MRINQVEELVGITKKNIRFYEDQGLLNPDRNPENGYREYTLSDVEVLNKIKLLRKLAIPIEEIRRLQTSELDFDLCIDRQIGRLRKEQQDVDNMIALCRKISNDVDGLDELEADMYLDEMKQLEKGGARFMDIETRDIIKKRGSIASAAVMIALLLGIIGLVIIVSMEDRPPLPMLILIIAILGVSIIGIAVALKQRINEINGGEEDEASKY